MEQSKNKLFQHLKFLKPGKRINDGWTEESPRQREWEKMYRNRWAHDRVVRSTHGVNCTGSCSWKIYVKDGIITSETQQTDYPTTGADFPEYEPRGCPRGASFSWYTYSPVRVKYPYVRSDLFRLWKDELDAGNDPVTAWKNITGDPDKRQQYVKARGKGGFVRADWRDVCVMIASSIIHTIQTYGPDRVTGFSPIPAMSMVSYSGGSRFLSLIGGNILSFYDWYADLPPASPQVWGEQTDVPESGDWYNTKYFIIWGTNLPQTRTPDAHFMVESRYNGTKVVGVSPDYAEYEKFADMWLPARAGTDAALAMAMTHVILKEFYVDEPTPYFMNYTKKFTDLPFLITVDQQDNEYRSGRFLHADDLNDQEKLGEWKTVVWDLNTNEPTVPNGTQGHRWDGGSKWNLELEKDDGTTINPELSFLHMADEEVQVEFPYFAKEHGDIVRRGVPVKYITDKDGNRLRVTTVYDLMMAHTGISRGLQGDYPTDYDDPKPYTPAWQESITGVRKQHVIQVAREFADNAKRTEGKSMIAMGGGTNHWYHSDQIYRSILNLVLLTGSQGVNGGGWAHYVGQEKVRPVEGWQTVAFAKDWGSAPRQQNGTSFFYFATDQYRYEERDVFKDTAWGGKYNDMHPADINALAARLGWLPSYPQFTQNSIDLAKEARENGAQTDQEVINDIVHRIKDGKIDWSIENPDDPRNFPRVFFNWRSNLLGDSGKGHEFFVKHLIGGDDQVMAASETSWRPETVHMKEEGAEGKADLFVSVDFRMTSSGLFSDIVLPAATWYEKYDLSTTDLHPFIHPFNAAISPPWESKSDWATFREISKVFSELAEEYLPGETEEILTSPLGHDTTDEIAQPNGKILDWRKGETEAVPGKTMPNIKVVKRDYPNVYQKMTTIGPALKKGYGMKGVKLPGAKVYDELKERLGVSKREGIGKGNPDLYTDMKAAETILLMSGATNGKRAVEGWESMEEKTGQDLSDIAKGHEETFYTMADLTAQPRQTISTPVWSGLEKGGRRYSPFTVNTEYSIPWRTLTGRQSFYLDHEMMLDFGEGLPTYLPPVNKGPYVKGEKEPEHEEKSITVRYLTPHQKWGIHTMFTETSPMVQLFRGWQVVWMNEEDGASIGLKDNDWIEVYNRNGAIAARVVLTYRLPRGTAYMYHAQDRTMGVPGTTVTKKRGGTHNSVTRITAKPTHMIGGYSQLSYGFNYYGPTGSQRDTIAVIKPMKEVNWLEN
ncbi:nitrate reductase subunit alpha [Lentibacillus cibarius]|uniref:nitrate reductase (quinone) n=1 Tax=Lentibacillus cibarius TaxID=2583219 RepID=A0A5S3QMS1_9BACI|nr:nitrate reductase subunit alpha [Lentibacillus cibarius]TMN23079.1 nitrate reductase subunit alpha [Lentibacillus cibarius]